MIERYVDRRGRRHNLLSIVLDDDGLILHHRHGPATRLDKADLTEFRWLRGGAAEIVTTRGRFRLERTVERLEDLAAHINAIEDGRQKLDENAANRELRRRLAGFTAARVQITRGPALVTWLSSLFSPAGLFAVVPGWVVYALTCHVARPYYRWPFRPQRTIGEVLIGFGVFLGLCVITRAASWIANHWPALGPRGLAGAWLRADATQVLLEVPGRIEESLLWADLTAVEVGPTQVVLRDSEGQSLSFYRRPAAEPVVDAAQRLLALRAGFHADPGFVPDAAISRAEGHGEVDRRAISPAEKPQ
jgi:hypothetical protein